MSWFESFWWTCGLLVCLLIGGAPVLGRHTNEILEWSSTCHRELSSSHRCSGVIDYPFEIPVAIGTNHDQRAELNMDAVDDDPNTSSECGQLAMDAVCFQEFVECRNSFHYSDLHLQRLASVCDTMDALNCSPIVPCINDAGSFDNKTIFKISSPTEYCPVGFYLPDDPFDPRNVFGPNSTTCALACESPQWSPKEWRIFRILNISLSSIGLFLVLFSVASRLVHPKYCLQTMVFIFLISSAVYSLTTLITELLPAHTSRCSSNTVPLDSRDGPSMCAAQGLIMLYAMLVGCMAWCIELVNLLTKMRNKVPDISATHSTINVILAMGIPLIPTLYAGITHEYGYSGLFPFCQSNREDHRTLEFNSHSSMMMLYLPAAVCLIVGFLALIPVAFAVGTTVSESYRIESDKSMLSSKSLRNRSSKMNKAPSASSISIHAASVGPVASTITISPIPTSSKSKFVDFEELPLGIMSVCWNKLELIASPIQHGLPFFVLWITLFMLRLCTTAHSETSHAEFQSWMECVFDVFNNDDYNFSSEQTSTGGAVNESSSNYYSICGDRPSSSISFAWMAWVTACLAGQSILVAIIHPPVVRFTDLLDIVTYRFMVYKMSVQQSISFSPNSRRANNNRRSPDNRFNNDPNSGRHNYNMGGEGGLSIAVMGTRESAFVIEELQSPDDADGGELPLAPPAPQQQPLSVSNVTALNNSNTRNQVNNANNNNPFDLSSNPNGTNSHVQNNSSAGVSVASNPVAPSTSALAMLTSGKLFSFSFKLAAAVLPIETVPTATNNDPMPDSNHNFHFQRGVSNDSYIRRGMSNESNTNTGTANNTFRRNHSNDRAENHPGGTAAAGNNSNPNLQINMQMVTMSRTASNAMNSARGAADNNANADAAANTAPTNTIVSVKRRYSDSRFLVGNNASVTAVMGGPSAPTSQSVYRRIDSENAQTVHSVQSYSQRVQGHHGAGVGSISSHAASRSGREGENAAAVNAGNNNNMNSYLGIGFRKAKLMMSGKAVHSDRPHSEFEQHDDDTDVINGNDGLHEGKIRADSIDPGDGTNLLSNVGDSSSFHKQGQAALEDEKQSVEQNNTIDDVINGNGVQTFSNHDISTAREFFSLRHITEGNNTTLSMNGLGLGLGLGSSPVSKSGNTSAQNSSVQSKASSVRESIFQSASNFSIYSGKASNSSAKTPRSFHHHHHQHLEDFESQVDSV